MKNTKKSSGLLMYRFEDGVLQFLLVHPGGPFWAKQDAGVWSIPKGEFTGELPLDAAKREFGEETGFYVDYKESKLLPLKPATLKSGKIIYAWVLEGRAEVAQLISNIFMLEWPPKLGKYIEVPEVDKAGWFNASDAILKINAAQAAFIYETIQLVG